MKNTTSYLEGRGPSTPWGRAQYSTSHGRGIASMGTAGHGGIRVSRKMAESTMPREALRQAISRGGYYWFEEDCAFGLVVLCFPGRFEEKTRDTADSSVKNWFPEAYTAITGQPVALEDSYELQRRKAEAENFHRFVVKAAWGSGEDVPEGMVKVLGRRASDGAEKTAFVPKEAYRNRSRFGYVLPEAA